MKKKSGFISFSLIRLSKGMEVQIQKGLKIRLVNAMDLEVLARIGRIFSRFYSFLCYDIHTRTVGYKFLKKKIIVLGAQNNMILS
jgi:hypothetical protein